MGTINYLQAIKPDTAYIKKIINASLLFDWAINIEYQEAGSGSARWSRWDDTFFALRSAGSVIESLMNCYKSNPECTIRINAEKFRPQSRLLYTAYNPAYAASETEVKAQDSRTWLLREQGASISPTSVAPSTQIPD